jgi:acyl-CoA synthetase (AMP-forming)/AMP-acid ligase II
MSLLDLYDLSLKGRADAPALACDGPDGLTRTLTFGDLDRRSDRLATVLRARGLARGDRLAFCLVNRLAVIDLWIACVKLGVIVVPINVLYKGREIGHIVGDAKPRAVVTTSDRAVDLPDGTTLWDVDALEREAAALFSDWSMAYVSATAEQVARWAGLSLTTATPDIVADLNSDPMRVTQVTEHILRLLAGPSESETPGAG